jgi:hypothetical protein
MGEACRQSKTNCKTKNIRVKTDVIVGISSVVKQIVDYAHKKKIDMIVVGK